MASRVFNRKERSIPFLSFKFRPEIPISVSAPNSIVENFILKVHNENQDISKIFRSFILNRLGVQNEQELRNLPGFLEAEEMYKKALLLNLKIGKGKLSSIFRDELMKPYIKE